MKRHHAVALLSSMAGGVLMQVPRTARGQGLPDKLRIAGPLTEDLVPVFYGIKTGIFKRNALDIELVGTANSAAAAEAVVTGTYEIAKAAITSTIAGHLRGIPLSIIAPQAQYTSKSPFALLQVAVDAPFKSGRRS